MLEVAFENPNQNLGLTPPNSAQFGCHDFSPKIHRAWKWQASYLHIYGMKL